MLSRVEDSVIKGSVNGILSLYNHIVNRVAIEPHNHKYNWECKSEKKNFEAPRMKNELMMLNFRIARGCSSFLVIIRILTQVKRRRCTYI